MIKFETTISEKIALAQIANMSREELEEYAFGCMMDILDDYSEDELADLAEQYEVV
jgi:hypothetical protein